MVGKRLILVADDFVSFTIYDMLIVPLANAVNDADKFMPTTGLSIERVSFLALNSVVYLARRSGMPEEVTCRSNGALQILEIQYAPALVATYRGSVLTACRKGGSTLRASGCCLLSRSHNYMRCLSASACESDASQRILSCLYRIFMWNANVGREI